MPQIAQLIVALLLSSAPAEDHRIDIEVEQGRLAATVLDAGQDDGPVAILVAGSGPTDRDGNQPGMRNDALRKLAVGLQDRGIATLRYDKRGIAGSTTELTEADLRVHTFAADLAAAIRQAANRWPNRPVFLVGHSEGSLMTLLAADMAEVDGIVSLAGAGRPAPELLREQLAARVPVDLLEQATQIMEAVQAGRPVDAVPPSLAALFRPSVQPYLRSWFEQDPAALAAALSVPVLAVQGTTDLQVGETDACRLAGAGDHVRVLLVDNMNHVLRDASGGLAEQLPSYRNPDAPLHPELLPAVAGFIRGETVGTADCESVASPAVACASPSGQADEVAGDWGGTIEPIGLRIVFHLQADADGCLQGTFDSPDQGGFGLPLSAVTMTDGEVELRADAFGFVYRGSIEGRTMSGDFTQGGNDFRLALERDQSSPAQP